MAHISNISLLNATIPEEKDPTLELNNGGGINP